MAYYVARYKEASARTPFKASDTPNWEAQHPPLYYLLMAPVMRATDGWAFVNQIFVLRLFSFLLAFAGLVIGIYGSLRYTKAEGREHAAKVAALYPLAVPTFIPEFARLGNDSLCLFLMGLIWPLILRSAHGEGGRRDGLTLGVLFGLGLLTKAIFLPVFVGFVSFSVLHLWRNRSAEDKRKVCVRTQDMAALAVAPLMAGAWYLYEWSATGAVTGSGEIVVLNQQGGLWANLVPRFTILKLLAGVEQIVSSWSWAGSASLVVPPPAFMLPITMLSLWLAYRYLQAVRRAPLSDTIWLPLWLAAPLLAGLLYHVLIVIARGSGGTPGWYLNILAPVFVFAAVKGWERSQHSAASRWLIRLLIVYASLFLFVVLWLQMALFAGCAGIGADATYVFPGSTLCLEQFPEILRRLDVFAYPTLALVCAAGAALLLVWGLTQKSR